LRTAAGNLSTGGDENRDAGLGVVQRVLPDVAKSASETIQGTIKVGVRVNVDPSGGVTGAEMVVPGPSRYFARLSLESARKWRFAPSSQDARRFLLNFEYRNTGTRAYAARAGS
jgi:TonB family protein